MISGALVDKQNEFETFAEIESAAALSSNNRLNMPRSRKSGNVKLRFHHQALPQQYLQHYEATQTQTQAHRESPYEMITTKAKPLRKSARMPTTSTISSSGTTSDASTNDKIKSEQTWPQKDSTGSAEPEQREKKVETKFSPKLATTVTKVSAQDLPYMGEITLDNFKPRRGRKPKKADICHLIYKNYGTVLEPSKPDESDTKSTHENTDFKREDDKQFVAKTFDARGEGRDYEWRFK